MPELTKDKPKKFKAILIICISIYIIILVYTVINNMVNVYEVNYGEIEQSINLEGLIIQNETVLTKDINNNVIFQKEEGDRVGKNNIIAVVQDDSYTNQINNKINDIDKEIKEIIKKEEEQIDNNVFNSDTLKIDEEIQQEAFLVCETIKTNNYLDILEHKRNIDKNMRKKIEVSAKSEQTSNYIATLLKERNDYENQLNKSKNNIVATKSGIVSYKVDGFEDVITQNKVGMMSVEYLKNTMGNIQEKKYNISSGIKIIDNFEYYISFIIEDMEILKKIEEKSQVWLRINSQESDLITANIHDITKEDGVAVLTLKVTSGFENNLNERLINADIIWQKDKGLLIPVTSLVAEDNKAGVIAVVSNYFRFKEVEVIVKNDKYAIIKETDFNLHEYNKEKNVVLYDQILKKGSLRKVGTFYK